MQYTLNPVTPYQQNCSLAWCEDTKEAVLIDPGGEVDRLLEEVRVRDLTLVKIVLTHGHLDHVGGTAELVKRAGLPVEGPHKDDDFWISALPSQCKMMNFPLVEPFTPDRWLKDGDSVVFGKQVLEVIHCPGHTPGHVVLFHRESKNAFVGDVLFAGSIGRTDFPRGNHQDLIDSIRNKLWPLGDDVVFVPGHGPQSTFGHERKTNNFVADHRFG